MHRFHDCDSSYPFDFPRVIHNLRKVAILLVMPDLMLAVTTTHLRASPSTCLAHGPPTSTIATRYLPPAATRKGVLRISDSIELLDPENKPRLGKLWCQSWPEKEICKGIACCLVNHNCRYFGCHCPRCLFQTQPAEAADYIRTVKGK